MIGGILATPDLVFSGEPDGHLRAGRQDPAEGVELQPGGGVSAPPMTFEADGKRSIALLVGQGGAWDKSSSKPRPS